MPLRDTNNGGRSLPCLHKRGGECMVTYEALFSYTMVIISVITLVLACKSRDK